MPEHDLPIEDAIDRYLADCRRRGLRPDTIRYYLTALKRFADGGRCPTLAAFTRATARNFQDESLTLAAGSMRGYLRALRTFSTWLEAEDLLDTDPLAKLALPRVDHRLILVPSDTELLALLDASTPPLKVAIAILAGTGLRISNVCALDQTDVAADRVHVWTTKSRGGRVVPLDATLIAILETYRVDLRPSPTTVDDRALFLSRTGRRMTASAARLALTSAATRAHLPMAISPHVPGRPTDRHSPRQTSAASTRSCCRTTTMATIWTARAASSCHQPAS